MSERERRDTSAIRGLFSTRSQRVRTASSSAGSQNQDSANPRPSQTLAMSADDVVRQATPQRSARSTHANRTIELSSLAINVMQEARRELGSDGAAQQQLAISGKAEVVITQAVDRVLKKKGNQLDDIERANVILSLQKDLVGWGVIQPLIDNREVTDIHVYDYKTIVLQRGKVSETTGLAWPSPQAYVTFIDRLLLRLGKSLTTQQHTVDASLPNGIRLCAVHESVCGQRGPLLCIRVPRISEVSLDSLIKFQVAPPLIIQYLASLTRSGLATIMVAGETGTGKTTLMRCLASQFGSEESIVAVEDTPELNLQHPYFRSLISRPPNSEGIGEVTLQEHIKTTLRMTPTRVLLGEMRTPLSAEAFLESAQTGHVGMSTVHARNARETLVRLESLLGRAQKSVSIDIIRQQIALAVDSVVWLIREKGTGRPRIAEVIEVGHFIEGQIQIRPMFTLIKQGVRPVWRVDSWNSNFSEQLKRDGVNLGDSAYEMTFPEEERGARGD